MIGNMKIKKVSLLVTMIVLSFTLNAQSLIKYHGELNVGYSLGVGTYSTDRVNLHTIHGVNISEYFSTGIGVGLDYYTDLLGDDELVLPVFLNVKGYLPVSDNISPFISCDFGVGIGLTEGVKDMSGFYCTPAVGLKLSHLALQVGYNMQKHSSYGFGYTMGAVQFKLGYMF